MRRFQSITRTLGMNGHAVSTVAIADDGTAWYSVDPNDGQPPANWRPYTPLPQPPRRPLIDEYATTILEAHAANLIDNCTAYDHAYDLNDDVYQRVHGELKRRDMVKRLAKLKALSVGDGAGNE